MEIKAVALAMSYSGSSNPLSDHAAVQGSIYPISVGDADHPEDHFVVSFPDPFPSVESDGSYTVSQSDVVVIPADGESLVQAFTFNETTFYRAMPLENLAIGERRV
jgi:hypothetical protein